MQAVIMAGGEGTRLRPLTCNLPKPMVPVLNAPMMEHIIELLKTHNFSKIACALWYLPEGVTSYFGDGSQLGIELDYNIEREPLGTAGSVKRTARSFRDTFVVVSGDTLTDIDLGAAVKYHQEKGAAATIVLTQVPNPLDYGIVLTDPDGKITQFLEKPSWDQVFSDTINTGIYILEPEVLNLVPDKVSFDFSRDLFPRLLAQGAPLFGYVAAGYWSDIGNLDAYREGIKDCLDGRIKLHLPQPAETGIYLGENVTIHPTAKIQGPVYLGSGTIIEKDVVVEPYTVTGENCHIGAGSSLKRSILWSGVQIGAGCQLRGAVCAKNTILQREVELYEGSVLAEKVQVGTMTRIAPDVKVWPSKAIPSGTRLRQSLVWGVQSKSSVFSQRGISGDIRGDLTPEALIQLGLSYGAFLKNKGTVLVTSDFTPLGDLAKASLICGLRAGGVNVQDGGEVVGQLTRFAVQHLQLDGALHCEDGGENSVVIQCWNDQGRLLSKVEQRSLETIYLREDFPRKAGAEVGGLAQAPDVREVYLQVLASHYPAQSRGFKVGYLGSQSPFGELVKDFLRLAGYVVVENKLRDLPSVVVKEDKWFFQDEEGGIVSDDTWWQVFVQSLAEQGGREVAVPIHRSRDVERAAKERNVSIRWTRAEPVFWMEAASELGHVIEQENVELFPHIEPLVSIGSLFSYLSKTKQPLSSWQAKSVLKTSKVECPWEQKGKTMRKLIESSNPDQSIYLDGVKEYQGSGWTLVVPDGDEPVFRLYTDADTETEAAQLLERYIDLISSYGNEER